MSENWYVTIFPKKEINDQKAHELNIIFEEFNIKAEIKSFTFYKIRGALSVTHIKTICDEVLVDVIENDFLLATNTVPIPTSKYSWLLKIMYKKGVMDAEGLSVKHTIEMLDLEIEDVFTGSAYLIESSTDKSKLENVIRTSFINELVQIYTFEENRNKNPYAQIIEIKSLSTEELLKLSKDLKLALNSEELETIREYFEKTLKRAPFDIELETIAQTWSEHCIHKTFRGEIKYKNHTIKNLLKTYIMKATADIQADWCVHVFDDNAGIIRFNEDYGLAVKVETHNHPTALDPYGGAGTGSGGVFRDAMGVGARPILSMNNLFFGPLHIDYDKVPKGVMHPKRLMKGSVSGIRDYGNKMGIPTANGSINFHEDYLGNPLVFAGVVGLLPLDRYVREPKIGDLLVLVGGKTGRDGIHGVTFASETLSSESENIMSSAVQIGNPLEQKRVLDALLKVRDCDSRPAYSAITDCGGGGLSSAIGEMGKHLGVEVNLDKVPLKYQGLKPWEIWISESQERMLLLVPPEYIDKVKQIFFLENCETTIIGKITNSKKLILKYFGEIICNIDMSFLHNGIPVIKREAEELNLDEWVVDLEEKDNYGKELSTILKHPNIASKEWVIRQYDHEVQANTIIKPLQGVEYDGHGDSCVIKPLEDNWRGFVVSNGFNSNYSKNPRKMALSSIDESIRNNICSGGRRFALLDNFSWGNPENPKNLGALVEACKACYDYTTNLQTPFISGKDSLYNDFITNKGELITIPHTLVITCVGIIPDIRKSVTSDFKKEENSIYLIGETKRELGGSIYFEIENIQGGIIPDVDFNKSKKIFTKMTEAIDKELIYACHDCTEGGIAVTLSEMCFGGNIGAEIDLSSMKLDNLKDYVLLFSESNTRFVVEVSDQKLFEKTMLGIPIFKIGKITGTRLRIKGSKGNIVIDEEVAKLKRIWQSTFNW